MTKILPLNDQAGFRLCWIYALKRQISLHTHIHTHTRFVFIMVNLKMWSALMLTTMKFIILSYNNNNNKIATFIKWFFKWWSVCRYQAKPFTYIISFNSTNNPRSFSTISNFTVEVKVREVKEHTLGHRQRESWDYNSVQFLGCILCLFNAPENTAI